MRINILLGAILAVSVLFPLSLSAQDSEITVEESDNGQGTILPDAQEGGILESFPGGQGEEVDESVTDPDNLEYLNTGGPTDETGQPSSQESTAQEVDPTPTPPQNLTYLDYFYYVRVRYGGTIPQDIVTDYNGDGKVNEQDKAIILQALNPDYDPATVTPSPTTSQQSDGDGPFNFGGNSNSGIGEDDTFR
jgi:hypothetical protein